MDNPLVSVIVPVYNSEPYLPELFNSLKNQTLQDFEILCIDDKSSDGSLKYLNMRATNDDRVRVIALQQNVGSGKARNEALKHVKGEYFCFVDSDDFIEPNMLGDLVDIAQREQADVVIFNLDQYREQDGVFMPMPWAVVEGKVPEGKIFWPAEIDNFYKYMVGFTVNKLYRTEYFMPLGIEFPDVGAHEDMPFTYAAVSGSKRVYYHDAVLYHYRRQREGSRSDETDEQFQYMLEALECLKDELIRLEMFDDYERCFENYVLHMAEWKFSSTRGLTRMHFLDSFRDEWADRLGVLDRPDDYFFIESEREFLKRALRQSYVEQLEDDLADSKAQVRSLQKKNEKLQMQLNELKGNPLKRVKPSPAAMKKLKAVKKKIVKLARED